MESVETELTLKIPTDVDPKYFNYQKNFSLLISDFYDDVSAETDEDYEQFLADVWVGIVLTLMVLCCVCCMCSCLLYHKFQQWKRTVEERHRENMEAGNPDTESLPSYTIVSGLPSYEEALEQLRKVKELTTNSVKTEDPSAPAAVSPMRRLSVVELFQLYRSAVPTVPAATSQKL